MGNTNLKLVLEFSKFEMLLDFEIFRGFNASSDPSPNRYLIGDFSSAWRFPPLVSTTKNENRAYHTYTLSALNCRKFFDIVPFTKQFYEDFTPGPSTIGRSSRRI